MRPSKSEIEKYYFELFRPQYNFPEGEIIYTDKPDVIVNGIRKLGIEITNFYADPTGTEQSQISMRLNAAKKAQSTYQNKTGKNIEYTFGFDRQTPIQNVAKMAKNLIILAERFETHPIGQISRTNFTDVPELSFIRRGGEYTDCEWRVSQTFSTPIMNQNRLIEIIREKEEKAKNYKICDDLWLLIVINFIDLAQDQEIMNVSLDQIESYAFQKVIIYKTGVEQIREVPIIKIN